MKTTNILIILIFSQVNKMTLEEGEEDFTLRSTDPRKPTIALQCQALNRESHHEWVANLTNILQTQKDFLKAIQSPIAYQKELTKDSL